MPDRFIEITTPLEEDVLLFHRMTAREEISRLSEFEIDLLSEKKDIPSQDILGNDVTVRLELPNETHRYFHGFVTRFSQVGMRGRYHLYHASVRPWLWFLTRTSNCRIFQKLTVPDILHKVFESHSMKNVTEQLTKKTDYKPWEYCVQYRETDFNFVSRLMEQEGIFYYFKHENGHHTLVLTDTLDSLAEYDPQHGTFDYLPHDRVRGKQEVISDWNWAHEVHAGKYAVKDYNFTKPKLSLLATKDDPKPHENKTYELYDYPGEYDESNEATHYAEMRLQEEQSPYEVVQGTSNVRAMATGRKFKLHGHPRKDQDDAYIVLSTLLNAEYSEYESMEGQGSDYSCSFKALRQKTHYRPLRITPKPIVQGIQTAVVVGRAGNEIYTDEYGRIKVKFHWDRDPNKDENSSCWMRVAQVWAGNNWGATYIPRIGQEVVVSFLEGDPDQPLVTGSVYNAIQRPPYLGEGRDSKHKNDPNLSGIKSNSTLGGEGFNELRFDDTKGKEQIFIHAEHDYDVRVKNEMMEKVLKSHHVHIGEDDRTKIDKNVHIDIGGTEDKKVGGNDTEKIGGNYDLKVGGNQSTKVEGTTSLTVGQKLQEKVGTNAALEAGEEIHLKAGMKVIIEAGMQISLKGPGGFIDIGPSGVTIQGTMVLINSGGAAGSGSGSSPTEPKDANPTAPTEADDSSSGSKSSDD